MFALEIYSLLLEREKVSLGSGSEGNVRDVSQMLLGMGGTVSPKSSILLSHVLVRIPPCSPEELKKNIGFGLKGGTQGRRGIL